MAHIAQTYRCPCEQCDKRPVFGMEGERARRCKSHAEPGMVNVACRRCEQCDQQPAFGMEGERARRCKSHAEPGMVDDKTRHCEQCSKSTECRASGHEGASPMPSEEW